jgi:glutamyl-tRNA synthetase
LGEMSLSHPPESVTANAVPNHAPGGRVERVVGRFAPSPTGPLHLGNLRTALAAWLFARSVDGGFIVRMEDLDRVTASEAHEVAQLKELSAIGIDWDGAVVQQSDRFALYDEAIAKLSDQGRTYECFCTRREIAEAASAPHQHLPDGAYPGTCRDLTSAERASRLSEGRRSAIRLRAEGVERTFTDQFVGDVTGLVDDFVLRRNDGIPAYNLAVVVDDALQGVNQVVRADDLLLSTPRQIFLAELLGFERNTYAHIPLVVGPTGKRLAKRDGAVTLEDRLLLGETPTDVLGWLLSSLGQSAALTALDWAGTAGATGAAQSAAGLATEPTWVKAFDPSAVPTGPCVLGA